MRNIIVGLTLWSLAGASWGEVGTKDGLCVGNDTGLVLLEKVEPIYPRRAEVRGITGFVTFQYDVSADGKVENVRLLDNKPPRIFDRAAYEALLQFKYMPRTVGDAAVATPDIRCRIDFSL